MKKPPPFHLLPLFLKKRMRRKNTVFLLPIPNEKKNFLQIFPVGPLIIFHKKEFGMKENRIRSYSLRRKKRKNGRNYEQFQGHEKQKDLVHPEMNKV